MGDLGEGLSHYQKQGFCSFHTPGHKGRQEFFNGLDFWGIDLTELPGLDMLHSPRGIIAEAQKRSAEIFGAEETFFLINGGTVGNQAMFLALENRAAKRVVVERSFHRSVMSALVLSGLKPEYVMPTIHPEFNLPLGFDVEQQRIPWQAVAACQVTYPSYYGTGFKLNQLLAERTSLGFDIPILVDQAHGSHYLGPLFPPSALKLGADLVLHSSHKTLSALTQSAMLHVQGHRVSRTRLRQSLELLQSSSPSYLLLASLERAGEDALDFGRWECLQEEVEGLHRKVGQSFRILSQKDVGTYGIHTVDWSKILINTLGLGVLAPRCVEYLREEYGIEPELWDEENILFMLGIGNTPEDIRLLTKGLEGLASSAHSLGSAEVKKRVGNDRLKSSLLPQQVLSPRDAFFATKRQIPLKESLGHIVGETISPYPPGIPVIVMGEQMTGEILGTLLTAREGRWQGWDGFESQTIWIVEV
ncbi:Orn/Lys/Arg decarboxylase, C-terminal domain protein [Candidatus Desulfosporosinus infrequens]|uniref:Orn/Lys/Arg decarboxylase, C-terminal domain protein n=1 Tax=Candidatus Desulfosporosinus infrequens TaxID=2043169 RepID=A0A2U3JWR9_9FIRM|nr:Orn/Lys/Arg decarboxylase, C-terminal domain protein [Candidatus Desulfosporosinus infrequens]